MTNTYVGISELDVLEKIIYQLKVQGNSNFTLYHKDGKWTLTIEWKHNKGLKVDEGEAFILQRALETYLSSPWLSEGSDFWKRIEKLLEKVKKIYLYEGETPDVR